ncbi:MAG: WecB/TagA/CpsF family glycosyltransferase, partial [Patescibacteria group bacterium]
TSFLAYTKNMNILGISVEDYSKQEVINRVVTHLRTKKFTQIVSLNPEILVRAQSDAAYRKLLQNSAIKLIDGTGVLIAGKILGIPIGERVTGVELMSKLITIADGMRLKVLIIGGYDTVASDLASSLEKNHSKAEFKGIKGYKDVYKPSPKEETAVQKLLLDYKPDLVFVAFGAPAQEFWIQNHKQFLKSAVCMVVGGAVDFLAGKVKRAPVFMQKIGLEWLFRLLNEPWRWKRQLSLVTFIKLVIQEKCKGI